MDQPPATFTATDERGRPHVVSVVPGRGQCGPGQDVKSATELRTTDGLLVRRIARGEYQVEGSGLILRSTDPNAP